MSDKQLKILCRFLIWLSIALLITFIGISNIFALETKTIYPNSDFTQNANNYIKLNSTGTAGITNVNLTIQGVAYGFYFSIPEDVSNNKTYTMVINFMDLDLLQSFQSSYVHISSCDSNSSCVQSSIISVTKSSSTGNSNKLTIKFNAAANGSYFNVGLASDGPPYQALTGVSTFGIKNVQLESSNTSEDIINNQNQNTNNIINNQNSNTQDIIDNQNSNASAIQDTINNNFESCRQSINLFNINGSYTRNNCTVSISDNILTQTNTGSYSRTAWLISGLKIGQQYTLSINYNNPSGATIQTRVFDSTNTNLLENSSVATSTSGKLVLTFNASETSHYLRFYSNTLSSVNRDTVEFSNIQLQEGTDTDYEPYGEQICTNKLDEQTNAINDLNDSINSTDYDISGLDNVAGWLPAGPVDSILNLPLNLFSAYTTALGLTCTPLNIPLPYVNKTLPIPCLRSIFDEIGISTWWNGFGYLAAAIILYNYLLNLYTWVDKTLTLRENTMPGYYDDKFGGGA